MDRGMICNLVFPATTKAGESQDETVIALFQCGNIG
jgi:hypothetical protein